MTTPPLKTLILAVQNTQDDLLALTWARERLFLVISVFAVILGFKGGGVPGYCEGHGSKFFADDTRFFCAGRLEGCLGPTHTKGFSVSTYRRPVAAILPQAVWRQTSRWCEGASPEWHRPLRTSNRRSRVVR